MNVAARLNGVKWVVASLLLLAMALFRRFCPRLVPDCVPQE